VSPPPAAFIEHLRASGYHPRSDKHSNALGHAIVADLLARCPAIAARASKGALVYDLNTTIHVGITDWNVDLVLGAPAEPTPPNNEPITRTAPSTIQIAIEFKAVMTEHRKAVKNRKRDLEAHHEHVHNYNDRAIAAGVLLINEAATFKSAPPPRAHDAHQPAEARRALHPRAAIGVHTRGPDRLRPGSQMCPRGQLRQHRHRRLGIQHGALGSQHR